MMFMGSVIKPSSLIRNKTRMARLLDLPADIPYFTFEPPRLDITQDKNEYSFGSKSGRR
jgi:hypothetical protein